LPRHGRRKNEIVRLLMAICAINVWNRMAISTHQALPGRDEAAHHTGKALSKA
jgi:hypothetical protein